MEKDNIKSGIAVLIFGLIAIIGYLNIIVNSIGVPNTFIVKSIGNIALIWCIIYTIENMR